MVVGFPGFSNFICEKTSHKPFSVEDFLASSTEDGIDYRTANRIEYSVERNEMISDFYRKKHRLARWSRTVI